MFINCKGIVIHELILKENNKLLTILTDTHGKLVVMGYRAKSHKNSAMPSCQLFCYSSFVLEQKKDRYHIVSAELENSFYNLRSDIQTLSLATYFSQISEHFALEGQECLQLLRLLLNSLHLLALKTKPLEIVKAIFELKLAENTGYLPDVFHCENCGNEVAFFSINTGKLICENCKTPNDKYILLANSCKQAINYILENELQKSMAFTASANTLKTLEIFSEKYLLNIADKNFKSLKFYKDLII